MKIPLGVLAWLTAGAILLGSWLLSSGLLDPGSSGLRHELRRYFQYRAERRRLVHQVESLHRALEEKQQMARKLLDGQATFAEAAAAMRYWSEWVNEHNGNSRPRAPVPPDEQACWERVLTDVALELKFHPRADGAEVLARLRAEMRQRFPERAPRRWINPEMEGATPVP